MDTNQIIRATISGTSAVTSWKLQEVNALASLLASVIAIIAGTLTIISYVRNRKKSK